MIYDDLYNAFVSLFPESADELNTYAKSADAEETDGMPIMFSFVVIPFVLELLKNNDTDKLTRAFSYFGKWLLPIQQMLQKFLNLQLLKTSCPMVKPFIISLRHIWEKICWTAVKEQNGIYRLDYPTLRKGNNHVALNKLK